MVPEPLRGKAFVSVDVAFLGSEADADRLLSPLRRLPACVQDSLGPVPFGELGGIAAEPVDPMPTSESSALLAGLDQPDVDRLLDVVGPGCDVPLAFVQVRHLGGALSRASGDHGPSGPIREQFQLFMLGVPMTPELDAGIAAAFAGALDAVAKQVSGRAFFNFLGADADPGAAFGPTALTRLREVKRSVDPDGVIRSNRPVLG